MAQISQSVEAIKLRLVGDSGLGSIGIVQDVEELKANQKKTAEVLSGVAKALESLEQHRNAQDKINVEQAKIAEDVRSVRLLFKAACVVLPIFGGVVGWVFKTDILKRLAS